MPPSQESSQEITFVANLKSIVSSFEEIAVMRIDRVRKLVLSARVFRERLADVYTQVRASDQIRVASALEKKKRSLRPRKAAVLLSTSARLSGSVVGEVSKYFIEHVVDGETDIVILGQVGKEHYEAMRDDSDYTFFSLPEGRPDSKALRPIIEHLRDYKAITVYFGRFQNLIDQKPTTVEFGNTEWLESFQSDEKRGEAAPTVH